MGPMPARLVERLLQACTDLRQQLIVTEAFCSPWQLEGTEEEDESSEADAQTPSVGLSALDSSLQARPQRRVWKPSRDMLFEPTLLQRYEGSKRGSKHCSVHLLWWCSMCETAVLEVLCLVQLVDPPKPKPDPRTTVFRDKCSFFIGVVNIV